MTDGIAKLHVWLSPAFPTGAFAYSHGLEQAHEDGLVTDRSSLERWLADLIAHGSARADAILLAAAHRAAQAGDADAIAEAAALCLALAPTAERHLETVQQGNAFLKAIEAAWPCAGVARFRAAWKSDAGLPVAVGVAAAGHAIPLAQTLALFTLAFVSNLVSAAVRLGIVGQTEGQQTIAALMAPCRSLAAACETATLDDLGGCTFRADIASARHETQYTRLFRS